MNDRICPLDGKPCEKSCPDRYPNDPRGGCILVAMHDVSEDYNAKKRGGDTMNDTQVNRDRYIEVIVELLKKANVEKLDLIWTFAKGIIR